MTWRLLEGDAIEHMKQLPDESVDAIITDPPYLKEYIGLYEKTAEQAKRILKPGGSFCAIVGHYAIPDVISGLSNHLKYRWIFSMWQGEGTHPRMAMGIEVMWKPIVWYVKGSWPKGRGFIRDGFVNDPIGKDKLHKWQQSTSYAEHCLKLVPKGGTVLDPFAGSGTTMEAAIKGGFNVTGIELEPEYCSIIKKRLEAII